MLNIRSKIWWRYLSINSSVGKLINAAKIDYFMKTYPLVLMVFSRFRTQSNIYDETFIVKIATNFLQKSSIVDVRLRSKYAPEVSSPVQFGCCFQLLSTNICTFSKVYNRLFALSSSIWYNCTFHHKLRKFHAWLKNMGKATSFRFHNSMQWTSTNSQLATTKS